MKVFYLLAIFVLAVNAIPEEEGRVHGENGWYIPRGDGEWEWVDMDEAEQWLEDMERMEDVGRLSTVPVTYRLYTKSNPTKGKVIKATTKSVDASNFNPHHPTRFIIHGWTQGYTAGMNKEIRDAWLSNGDFNIIVVDWARARSVDYASSVIAVPKVGKKVASMIDFLNKNYDMPFDNLIVIGHSLGAHVAGYTGKNVQRGQIHSIVGLDPALPLFNYNKPKKRLSSTDAFYVESIQTDGGQLGFLKPIGKGAFYPNGGKSQPGCGWDLTGACDHARSCTYYAEAVKIDDFPTIKCPDYEDAVKNRCGSTYSSVRMGAMSNAYMVAGDFYVPVHSKSPYGYGSEE